MKSLAVLSVFGTAGIVFACSGEPEPPYIPPATGGTGTGGAMGGTAGTTGGTGGGTTGGTGGATTGGTGGGTTGGTGGATTGGTGGGTTGGTGGAAAGTAGSGGAAGSMAGMSGSPAGGAGGAAGGMGGMSGSTSQGGMAGMSGGGAGNTGGMAGMGGTGSGVPTITELVGKLDGHLVITPCRDQPNGDDCDGGGWRSNAVENGANHACVDGKLEALIPFPVAGVEGQEYDVTMHFYGIMEPRQYSSVMREAGTAATNRTGATPTGWATANGTANVYTSGDNNYNTYEIHVYDPNNMRVAQYFINSDSGTGHYTLLTNYEKTITVIGGGEVRLRIFDNNCRQIKNCGANGGTGAACATNARSINISAAMPQPTGMPMLEQPGLGLPAQHSGQWWFIDVTAVAPGT
jgi:hypothetical protein